MPFTPLLLYTRGRCYDPEVIRVRELYLALTSCSTLESGPASHIGNTVEPADPEGIVVLDS